MQKDAIRSLIGQYMNDELTAQQQVELLQLLGQHEETELIDVLREMMEAESGAAATADTETMQASLQRVLAADKVLEPAMTGQLVKMRRWRWVAAAACLITVGIAAYVLLNKKSTTVPVAATTGPYKNDVQPGGQKALLTLGNGQQIVLDNAANGLLAQEGNAQVMKEGEGLRYQSTIDNKQSAITFNTLSTPRGGEYKLILPDGSKVWLNAASSIRYPTAFTGKDRSVEITGEAYFEVAKDPAKPFHVNSGAQEIEVLGTHFNVNAYNDEGATKTTLLEGRVKVRQTAEGRRQTKVDNEVILKPGEQAIMLASPLTTDHSPLTTDHSPLTTDNSPLTINRSPDLESAVAWTNNQFIFREQRIEAIMKQLSRWYNVEVAFAGKPTQEGFTASIPRNVPVSKVLKYLELTTLVHFTIDGNRITVLP